MKVRVRLKVRLQQQKVLGKNKQRFQLLREKEWKASRKRGKRTERKKRNRKVGLTVKTIFDQIQLLLFFFIMQ